MKLLDSESEAVLPRRKSSPVKEFRGIGESRTCIGVIHLWLILYSVLTVKGVLALNLGKAETIRDGEAV